MAKQDDKWYVTATDSFWYNSKMVMVCPDLKTAREWERKWESRSDLKRVNICCRKPYYPKNQVSYYDGANGGCLMESLRSEIVTKQIAADLRRL